MLLEARDVTVTYGGLVAVDSVSVCVDEGEIVGLVGPNGAGKTSLFEAISGFVPAKAGRVLLQGTDVSGLSPNRRARAGLVRTFQRLELFGNMSVLENLVIAAESRLLESGLAVDVLGLRREDRAAIHQAEEVADELGLGPVAHRLAGELPAGIGRIVEVGRALCARPKVLLLDEPTTGLDSGETESLAAVLDGLKRRGSPALFVVAHDVPFVSNLAGRVYVMEFGSLIAEGTPHEIRADPAVRRAYLGSKA